MELYFGSEVLAFRDMGHYVYIYFFVCDLIRLN